MENQAVAQLAWPVICLLAFALVVYRIGGDVRPVFISIVNGVAQNAQSNATAYAIAIMFGLSASLSAFYDVFSQLDSKTMHDMTWHQYASAWAKIANPFVVAVLAYATQNKFTSGPLAPPPTPPPAPPVQVVQQIVPVPEVIQEETIIQQ